MKMNSDIVNKSFYLSSLFVDIKSEHNWTTNETKVALLLFNKLSEHRIFIPNDLKNIEDKYEKLKELVECIPLSYNISKEEFREATNVAKPNLVREIKKTIKGLLTKIILMPHPLAKNDSKSIKGSTWFTNIEYLDNTGLITIEINKHSIEKLVGLVGYSKILFKHIVKIQNHNAIYTYLTLKILKDASKLSSLRISIDDYKSKLGLNNKYSITKTFQDRVLEVVKREINESTDLVFSYDLKKGESGKGSKYIDMTFNYKPEESGDKIKKVKQINSRLWLYLNLCWYRSQAL